MDKKSFVFFDVDKTVVAKDSFLCLIRSTLEKEPWRVFLFIVFLPIFAVTYLFKLEKSLAKSVALWSCTVFKSQKKIVSQLVQNGLDQKKFWFKEVSDELSKVRAQGHQVVYVSASAEIWLRAIVNSCDLGSKIVIGTKLRYFAGGVILKSRNCYHGEKVKRIESKLGNNIVWAEGFSDHPADIPFLKKCAKRHLINPKPNHLHQFKKELDSYEIHPWHV